MKFFSMWIGSKLTLYEELCFKSFYDMGQELIVYSTKDVELPRFILKRPLSSVISEDEIYRLNGSFSSFANRFRYLALSEIEEGNVWVDADILFKKAPTMRDGFLFGFESANIVNNAVLAAPADSQLLKFLIDSTNIQRETSWGTTGPLLLTKGIKQFGLEKYAHAPKEFYPIDAWKLELLLDPEKYEDACNITADSSLIHLYNELLIRSVVPKNILPPENSYLGKLFKEHGFNYRELPSLDQAWVRGWITNYRQRVAIHRIGSRLKIPRYIKNRLSFAKFT